ncbi:aldo/keto reductase [Haloarcula sp. Atlit-120R]|jgi:2,5-diketo-D-gluconate reductase B|uniref:aldo/keto reductase n=1 Tax=Haloarcula sp. Atlit-120R TaxID=2282135 RepID=UPI000EF264ED|nr:aldo/keto reductase [Haloarcula sp. Atlit-120R]RLM33067.1 aldo/keto reductase [Haloarcula sp. Atlit-120R]
MDVPTVSNDLPALGLGTYKNEGDQVTESVKTALDVGYRHIDTAQVYDNEAAVGAGIEASSAPREEVVVATKIWNDDLAGNDVVASAKESLDRLGLDRIEILYVHWPAGGYEPSKTIPAFNQLYDEGLVDSIAVSNFLPEQLETALDRSDAPIVANQVELHPLFQQSELQEFCETNGVAVVAYAPIARGKVFDVPELGEIAEKHGASEAQVSLAWLRQNGIAAIPKATSKEHIRANWESQDLTLDDEDLSKIATLSYNKRQVDPDFAPW